jgi:hypothetical protein
VSDPGDRFERAAADNAARVMGEPAPVQRHAEGTEAPAAVQREGEDEEETAQGFFVQRQDSEEPEEEAAE